MGGGGEHSIQIWIYAADIQKKKGPIDIEKRERKFLSKILDLRKAIEETYKEATRGTRNTKT